MWVALRVPGLDLTLPATLAGKPLLTPGLHTEGPHSSLEALQTPPPPPPSVKTGKSVWHLPQVAPSSGALLGGVPLPLLRIGIYTGRQS